MITYSLYEHSLEVCVRSVTRISYGTVGKQEGSHKDMVATTEKAVFPDAGSLLTQIPSSHLLFQLFHGTCGEIIPLALMVEDGLVKKHVLLFHIFPVTDCTLCCYYKNHLKGATLLFL